MIRTDKDMTVDNISTGMTIDAKAMEEEVNSLGIETHDCIDPPSASHVTKKVTGM